MQDASTVVAWCFAAAVAASAATAWGDVTTQQKTTLDVVSVVRMHGTITTSLTGDRKREDSESHCEGMMSLLCGNVQSAEIIRLDRDLSWHLEPDKKRYRETPFATPEELAAMRARMEANLAKMRSCPATHPPQQPVDQSKCEMSPPKFDVHKSDDKLSIAGHDAQRTSATMTETCTNKDTGDVCDTVVALDVWLTQDALPGNGDRRAFAAAYAKKLGLEDTQGIMRGEVSRFLAAYQPQIKQLTEKSSDFKGQPLKTTVRVLMGGPSCSAAKAKPDQAAAGGAGTPSVNPLADVAQAGKAVGQLMGGLFHKKKSDDSQGAASAAVAGDSAAAPATAATPTIPATPTTPTTPATPTTPDPFAQYTQLASFTTETVSISTDAISAARFDVPANWTKEVPKPAIGGDEDYTCPK